MRSSLVPILLQKQQNLILNSIFAGGPPPTSFSQPGGTGTLTAVASAFAGHTAMRFQASAERPFLNQSTVAVGVGDVLIFSFDVEAIGSSFSWANLLGTAGVSVTISYPATNCTAPGRYAVPVTCNAAGTIQVRMGPGVGSNATADITLSRPSLARGRWPYVPTTTLRIGV